jgi:hypothetical protein
MSSGVALQWVAWTVFNYGVSVGQRQIGSGLSIFGPFLLLRIGFFSAVIPGTMTGLMAALYSSPMQKMIASIGAAIFWLNVVDAIYFVIGSDWQIVAAWAPVPQVPVHISPSETEILFSVLSNFVGGALAGGVIGYVTSFFADARAVALPNMLKPERLLFVWVSLGLCVLPIVVYFCVFYQLPTSVRLHLDDWTALSFRFFGPSLPYSGVVDSPVAIGAEIVVSGSFPPEVTLRYSGTGESKDTSTPTTVTIASLPSSSGVSLLRRFQVDEIDTILESARVQYKGTVSSERIALQGVQVLAVNVGRQEVSSGTQRESYRLALPWRQYIGVSRAQEDFRNLVPEAVVEGLLGTGRGISTSTVVVRGLRGGEVTSPARGRVAVLLQTGGKLRIVLGGKDIVIDGSMEDVRRSPGGFEGGPANAALLVFESRGEGGQLAFSAGAFLACVECSASLRVRDVSRYKVGDVELRTSVGSVEVALKEYTMRNEGELYLGGEELNLEALGRSGFTVTGYGHPVLLNNVSLSQSLWSSTTLLEKLIVPAVIGVPSLLISVIRRRGRRAKGGA